MHPQAAEIPTSTSSQANPHALAWPDQLGLLLESTGEGIFGIDLDGLCVFINRAGAQMLGYDSVEVLGQNMHWLTHHSHADGSHYSDTDCPIFNAFRRGLSCRIDTEVFWRRDRSAFAVEYSSYPIMDGSTVRGAVVTFVDITQRKLAADALNEAKQQLEARVAERTQELQKALTELRELAAHTHAVREDERTRIAREVHDELGSLLVALKMDVNWLDKRLSEQQQRDAETAQTMRETMQSKCRNMSRLIEGAVGNVGRSDYGGAIPIDPINAGGVVDPLGRTVAYSAQGLPNRGLADGHNGPGLFIDAASGVVTGVIDVGQNMPYNVTVTATNGTKSISKTFVLTIFNDF